MATSRPQSEAQYQRYVNVEAEHVFWVDRMHELPEARELGGSGLRAAISLGIEAAVRGSSPAMIESQLKQCYARMSYAKIEAWPAVLAIADRVFGHVMEVSEGHVAFVTPTANDDPHRQRSFDVDATRSFWNERLQELPNAQMFRFVELQAAVTLGIEAAIRGKHPAELDPELRSCFQRLVSDPMATWEHIRAVAEHVYEQIVQKSVTRPAPRDMEGQFGIVMCA